MKLSNIFRYIDCMNIDCRNEDSPIHRIDPATKLCYMICIIFIASILNQIRYSLFCILISVSILLCAGVFRRMLVIFGITTIFLIIATLILGIFVISNQTPAFEIGGIAFHYVGLFNGIMIGLKVYNTFCALAVLALTTRTERLIDMGFPPKLCYFVLSAFQIFPQKTDEPETLSEEQFPDYPHAWLMRLCLGLAALLAFMHAVIY